MYVTPRQTRSFLGTSFATAVTPLKPFRVRTRYGDAMHDQIFGAKKGDQVTGAPPGEVYTTDQLSQYEYFTNPVYAGMVANDKNAQLFLAAVRDGWVQNSPEGLETLLSTIGEGYANGVALNGPSFDNFWAWFQTFQTGVPSASSGAPLAQPAAPEPIPGFPIGIQLLSGGNASADMFGYDSRKLAYDLLQGIIGARIMTSYTDGKTIPGPWVKTPTTFAVRDLKIGVSDGNQRVTGWWATRDASMEGIPNVVIPDAQRIELSKPAHIVADEAALLSFVRAMGSTVGQPAAWSNAPQVVEDVSATNKPIPIPPDGSVIHVPNADSGQEATIKLPGATEFIPVSSVPPSVWQAAAQHAAAPSGGPPNVVLIGEGAGGGVNVGVNGDGSGAPAAAGFGGLGGLLMIGAIVGLLIASSKNRR